MKAHEGDIGQADPLRAKVFGEEQGLSTDERLGYLIEFVAQLDDRLAAPGTPRHRASDDEGRPGFGALMGHEPKANTG